MTDTHGGLLSLCQIANAYRESEKDPSILEGHLRNVRCDLYLIYYICNQLTISCVNYFTDF